MEGNYIKCFCASLLAVGSVLFSVSLMLLMMMMLLRLMILLLLLTVL